MAMPIMEVMVTMKVLLVDQAKARQWVMLGNLQQQVRALHLCLCHLCLCLHLHLHLHQQQG